MTFLTILGVTEILRSFRLVIEGKTGEEIPESSRLGFLEKFTRYNSALSDGQDRTPRLLNRGGIVDFPLLRTLSQIVKKSKNPVFWEVIETFFFFLLAYASFGCLKKSFAMIASLSQLYFRFRRFTFLLQTKKSDFYELRQHHRQPKNMEMNETSPDTFDEGYIN